MKIEKELNLQEKLHILADAAKYDVACTSSGAKRNGKKGSLGNACADGICHSFASDGRCISLLKVLQTNHCIYDCKYCLSRASNDVPRTSFTPEELCELTMEFYKRNYIEGLFLSSAVDRSPAYTMEQMCRTIRILRTKYRFRGYVHMKAVPGAPEELLAEAGYLADRMSINLELPTAEGMRKLAPNKNHRAILKPMSMVARTIAVSRLALGKSGQIERSMGNRYLEHSIFSEKERARITGTRGEGNAEESNHMLLLPSEQKKGLEMRSFAAAGQSTQMIIGAAGETDYQLVKTTQYLYQKYDLKRVFYSAYIPLNEDSALPQPGTEVPLLREHRLYQADWLMRYYGFQAEELLSERHPSFHEQLDPKCDWALRHMEFFPVEVNKAPYDMLLRIPWIGPKSALRIMQARKSGTIEFEHLKRMGVVLKRAHFFITCKGRMMYAVPLEETYIMRQLTDMNRKDNWQIQHQQDYQQMSLFDDFHLA